MHPTHGFGWFLAATKKYATFQGRARRREFWYFYLFYVIASALAGIADAIFGTAPLLQLIMNFALWLPAIAVSIRRLHDTNRSGWWSLLPIVNIVFWAQDSQYSANRFGPAPKSSTEAPANNLSNADLAAAT